VNYRQASLRDYQAPLHSGRRRGARRALRWLLPATFAVAAIAVFLLSSLDANALRVQEVPLELPASSIPQTVEIEQEGADGLVTSHTPAAGPAATAASRGEWKTLTIREGDSLARIFSEQGLKASELHKILKSGSIAKKLTRIYPGQTLKLRLSDDTGLEELVYEIDAMNSVQIRRQDDGYDAQLVVKVPERRSRHATATIESSLFGAAQKAGLPESIAAELASLFGWDIDFALDIRRGDQFTVVYEELYLDGDRIGTGDILAAEFVNRGKSYQAIRYADASGHVDYYTPEGRSMRKSFLRTPVAFSRISSRFSLGRKHPILNRIRAHKGVDYAAPRGTPVKSTGAGRIVWRGRKGGYGKAIVIQHGSKYSTLYGHLSRYRRGLKVGSRVQQGQVIGYVGSTGLATGPHLHYEFRVNGVHRNPLTVRLPAAAPLPARFRDDFRQVSQSSLALLRLAKTNAVALRD